jgi:hypothetical protein
MFSIVHGLLPRSWLRAERLRRRVINWSHGSVGGGLFKGMAYFDESHGSVFLPKVLVTYELELAPLFARWDENAFERIVVAGAAEGYYAVGLALHFPRAQVTAFEPYPEARAALVRLADRNACRNRIEVAGICHCSALVDSLDEYAKSLVLVDIEGGEALLLDPRMVPALNRVTMLVEIHEFAFPGIESLLNERFSGTHTITRVNARERTIDDLPAELRKGLPSSLAGVAIQAMNEQRPPGMFWMLFEPTSVSSPLAGQPQLITDHLASQPISDVS